MLDSWKRRLGSGDRSTRSVVPPSESAIPTILLQALQLLEYLIKHGSERVVDDARSHISTLKMLRNFHYIDDKGKDEGINGKSNISCHSLGSESHLLPQSVTDLGNSSSFSRMSRKFVQSAAKPKRISTSTSELATTAPSALVLADTAGSEMILFTATIGVEQVAGAPRMVVAAHMIEVKFQMLHFNRD